MSKYILSTMTGAVSYAFYNYVGNADSKGAGLLPVIRKKITIFGGAGIPSNRSGFGEMSNDAEGQPMWTASGIITPVSEEDYEVLKDHELFRKHVDGGYLKVINEDIRGNHKAVQKQVRSMEEKDTSAQLTPQTIKSRVKVKTPLELEQETQFRL